MNQRNQLTRSMCFTALLMSLSLSASFAGTTTTQKHVITVQTNGAEVIEADVSALQPGEGMSFTTENGQLIDILKGVKGVEIYLDGELIGSPGSHELEAAKSALLHEHALACADADAGNCRSLHTLHRELESQCDLDNHADCEPFTYLEADDEVLLEEWVGDDDQHIIVLRKARHVIETD